ncbi:27635_t:CDS:2, partial [Gigaspora margarita]
IEKGGPAWQQLQKNQDTSKKKLVQSLSNLRKIENTQTLRWTIVAQKGSKFQLKAIEYES